jgi:hypothetical protein
MHVLRVFQYVAAEDRCAVRPHRQERLALRANGSGMYVYVCMYVSVYHLQCVMCMQAKWQIPMDFMDIRWDVFKW